MRVYLSSEAIVWRSMQKLVGVMAQNCHLLCWKTPCQNHLKSLGDSAVQEYKDGVEADSPCLDLARDLS